MMYIALCRIKTEIQFVFQIKIIGVPLMINNIRYKSWRQALANRRYSLQKTNLFYIELLTCSWRLWFSKITSFSTIFVRKWSWANTKNFWKPYCSCASLTHQDSYFIVKYAKFILVVFERNLLPHPSSLKASAGVSWPFGILYTKKDMKQLRRVQTSLGNLRYGEDWKYWIYLAGRWGWEETQ